MDYQNKLSRIAEVEYIIIGLAVAEKELLLKLQNSQNAVEHEAYKFKIEENLMYRDSYQHELTQLNDDVVTMQENIQKVSKAQSMWYSGISDCKL